MENQFASGNTKIKELAGQIELVGNGVYLKL